MISRISHMKIGGDTLRLAIREEIRTMQDLRVKVFCEAAAAAQKETMEKHEPFDIFSQLSTQRKETTIIDSNNIGIFY